MLAWLRERVCACTERLLMSKHAAQAAVSTDVRVCEWRGLNLFQSHAQQKEYPHADYFSQHPGHGTVHV